MKKGPAILASVGGEWPLTGRTVELEQIGGFLNGTARGLLLAGPAGTGKSRLALESLRLADEQRMFAARVVGTRTAGGIPLGAFAPLLPTSHHGGAGAVDTLADLLRKSAARLAQLAGDRRLLLVVEDANLLDETSATLVHQLVATGSAFVIATMRTGEAAPDAIVALWKDEGVERLDIGPLPTDAIAELLRKVLGGPVETAALRAFTVGSRGNVLFLRELVLAALGDGVLRDEGGIWRLAGRLPLSNRLTELIEDRLERVSEPERDLLEALSFGEPVGLAELEHFGGEAVAERLERGGLVSSRTSDRRLEMWLAHPLYGQALRARITPLRSRAIARALAEAVERTGLRRREDVLRVATWRLEGGGAGPDLMAKAAATARWRYDFPLAERLARAAVDAGAGFDTALLAAQVASLQGRGAEAEGEFTGLAERAGDDRERALVAISRLDNQVFLADPADGLRIAEDSERLISDGPWRDEILAKRATLLAGIGGPRAALTIAEPLIERAGGRALAWVSIVVEYAWARMGRNEAVFAAAARGEAAHEQLTEPMNWYPWLHDFFRCEALVYAGSLSEASAMARGHYEAGLAEGSSEAQAFFALALARIHSEEGLLDSAAARAQEAVALFRELHRLVFVHEGLSRLTLARALAGDAPGAARALAEIDSLGLASSVYWGTDLVFARAWAAVAADDLPAGRRLLDDAAELSHEIGDLVGEVMALHGLARLGLARPAADRLDGLDGQLEGCMGPLRIAHTRALAAADPEALEDTATRFAALGAFLLAAEAASDAAVGWHRMGRGRRAAGAERQASVMMHRCESARTPALLPPSSRSALTRAERDAALLAAAGHTNKDIAAKLHLSVRTIEAQLQRVYSKLGITSRGALREVLESGTDLT